MLRLRTPTIVRPEDRRGITKWLDTGLPLLSGHLGLVAEFGRAGRDVVADYAVNVMNQHSAARLFQLGARRIVVSVELTVDDYKKGAGQWWITLQGQHIRMNPDPDHDLQLKKALEVISKKLETQPEEYHLQVPSLNF